ACIENFAHLAQETDGREWLRHECAPRVRSPPDDVITSIKRHEKYFDVWILRRERISQLTAIHHRHHCVGYDELDLPSPRTDRTQRFGPVRRLDHCIAIVRQHPRREREHTSVV